MTQPPYKQPPITEAVIAINFAKPIDPEEAAKVSDKFSVHYPQHQNVENVKVALQIDKDQTKSQVDREIGHRRSSPDVTELLVLWRSAFVVSQLAPYPGWDEFFQRFVRDWKLWKRTTGFRTIGRLGVRYINRIDIPMSGPVLEYENFLNVYPKLPDSLGAVGAYAVQAVLPIRDIGCNLTINSAVVPAPVLGHASFVIDQDIAKEVDPPQSDEAIYELLNEIRVRKNNVFEACISNRARELFQR